MLKKIKKHGVTEVKKQLKDLPVQLPNLDKPEKIRDFEIRNNRLFTACLCFTSCKFLSPCSFLFYPQNSANKNTNIWGKFLNRKDKRRKYKDSTHCKHTRIKIQNYSV